MFEKEINDNKIPDHVVKSFQLMIPIYEDAIDNCPKDDWKDWISDKNLDMGICNASEKILGIHVSAFFETLYWRSFVSKLAFACKDYDELIQTFNDRILIMKEILAMANSNKNI